MIFKFPLYGAFEIFSLRMSLCLILFLSGFTLSAQRKFQAGYIVTIDNNTIHGLLRDRKDAPFAKIYKKIRFRDGQVFTKRYSPEKIAGYMSGERSYESLWLDVRTDFLKTSYWSIPNAGEKRFMKVLLKEYLSCYEIEFLDHDSGNTESITLFKRQDEDQFIRVTQGIFGLRKNSLRDYFGDCPGLIDKMDNGELKFPVEIALYYNQNCGIR